MDLNKKGVFGKALSFYIGLKDQANPTKYFTNPVIGSTECQVTIDDANEVAITSGAPIGTLTVINSSSFVKVTLAAATMRATRIALAFKDASNDWCDLIVNIEIEAPNGTLEWGAATGIGSNYIEFKATTIFANDHDAEGNTVVIIDAATGAAQDALITGYVASTRRATIDPAWNTTVGSTPAYEVLASPRASTLAPANANVVSVSTDAITAAGVKADAVTKIQGTMPASLATIDGRLDTEIPSIISTLSTIDSRIDTEITTIINTLNTLASTVSGNSLHRTIAQEILITMAMARGNKVVRDTGTNEIIVYGTDGTTEISRQPYIDAPTDAPAIGAVG